MGCESIFDETYAWSLSDIYVPNYIGIDKLCKMAFGMDTLRPSGHFALLAYSCTVGYL